MKAICSDAKREKEKHTKQNAKANQMAHNAIYDTRNNASQKRAQSASARMKEAQSFRQEMHLLESERQSRHEKWIQTARATAQTEYDKRFVPDESRTGANSEVGSLLIFSDVSHSRVGRRRGRRSRGMMRKRRRVTVDWISFGAVEFWEVAVS